MLTQLNDIQIQLAEQLLISVIKKEPRVEYKELASRMVLVRKFYKVKDPPIFTRILS